MAKSDFRRGSTLEKALKAYFNGQMGDRNDMCCEVTHEGLVEVVDLFKELYRNQL